MHQISYLPILELRPAEMLALEELPNKDKDALLPLFRLRPWAASNQLSNSIERLKKAFGERPCFLEVADEEYIDPDKWRPVHTQLKELRLEDDGYLRWFEFLSHEGHLHFIPALQLGGTLPFFYQQIDRLYSLGRGLLVRLESPTVEALTAIALAISTRSGGGLNVTFVLDYEKQGSDFERLERVIQELIRIIKKDCPNASIALSASSFPGSFTSISSQKIYERILFDRINKELGSGLIYSDRGSTRAERQLGGGGVPAPRIDYPKKDEWLFFRQSIALKTAFEGYQAQASLLMRSPNWDKGLKLWGSQMIERTASGDSQGGISSPNRSTATRINLHLHRQIYYGDDASFFDTDEDWTD